MLERLPEIIDPLVFAERRTELKGKLKLSSLDRLKASLLDDSRDVDVELFFHKQGRYFLIDGLAKTVLSLQCQNCLESVALPIEIVIKLGLITRLEQADELLSGYEPLLIDDDKMPLKDIVEDELLLALPSFPKHSEPCLLVQEPATELPTKVEQIDPIKSENPFAVLAKLKKTGDK